MKVVLVTETFYPDTDGTTTTVKAVADRLIDTGHRVLIVAPGPGLATYRGCRVSRIRPHAKPGGQVREALEGFDPEVVHVADPGRVGRKALKHARGLGARTVTVQQSPLRGVSTDAWRTKVADRSDRVLVTARWMVDALAEIEVPAQLWAPGVDTDAFNPNLRDRWLHTSWSRARARGGPRVVVGYVGSLRRRHGVRRLAGLADLPGVRPVLIGDGPQSDWLAERLPGAKLTGPLATGDLTVALATLDVLVHPGESETCCHALREAAASEVPVVAPRAGGAPDVVRSLESGLLYDPGDPHGLVRAVTAVAADEQRSLLGEAGRRLALRRTWRDAADELVARHYRVPVGVTAA